MYKDESAGPPALVCVVGSTKLSYQLRCIKDLPAMLKEHGDWIPLGSSDEKQEPKEGIVEAWGRSPDNPVRGWYGLRKGFRGRFANYVPPLLEVLGLVELEHNARHNRHISHLRLGIDQDIYRLPDHKPIVCALVTTTSLNERGRPQLPETLDALVGES